MKAFVLKHETHGYATGPVLPGTYSPEINRARLYPSVENAEGEMERGDRIMEVEIGVIASVEGGKVIAEPEVALPPATMSPKKKKVVLKKRKSLKGKMKR